jgi:hypothetical protein
MLFGDEDYAIMDDDDWIHPDIFDTGHRVKYVKDGATVYEASDTVDGAAFIPTHLVHVAESMKRSKAATGLIKVFFALNVGPDHFEFSPTEVVFHKDGNDVICTHEEFQDKDVYICKINGGPDTTTLLATAHCTVPTSILRKLCPDGDISLHCMSRGKITAIDFDEACGIQASAPPSPLSVLTAFVTS